MFSFLNKEQEIMAPVTGKTLDIKDVPDEVFSSKMVGDGIAIDPSGDTFVAPADGILKMLFATNHAYALELKKGVEILVHIGLDTVGLNGEGFTALKKQGDIVKKGEAIIKIDPEFIKSKGISLISPVIFTEPSSLKEFNAVENKEVKAGEDVILTYKTK